MDGGVGGGNGRKGGNGNCKIKKNSLFSFKKERKEILKIWLLSISKLHSVY